MRIKTIPSEAISYVEAHPATFAVGAVVVIGGYLYYRSLQSPSKNVDANPVASANSAAPFTYGMPQIIPTDGSGASAGLVDTAVNPNAPIPAAPSSSSGTGGTDLDWAMFHLEETKTQNDYSLAQQSLDAQLAIAAANTQIAMAGIGAANFQTDTQLAEAFLQSGSMYMTGNVGGQTFSFLQAPKLVQGANNFNAEQTSLFNQLQASYNNGLQPVSGTMSVAPYGSTPTSPTVFSGGSTSYSPTYSSNPSGSTQYAVNDNVSSGSGSTLGTRTTRLSSV